MRTRIYVSLPKYISHQIPQYKNTKNHINHDHSGSGFNSDFSGGSGDGGF
jgi:hypothetical protein